jgi:starch synthase
MSHVDSISLIALHYAEYAEKLAIALARKCRVQLILYSDNAMAEIGESRVRGLRDGGVSVLLLRRPKGLAGVIANFILLRRHVAHFAPMIVHVQEDARDELALCAPFLAAWPLVLTIHDPQPHSGLDSARFRFSRHRVYRWVLRRFATAAIVHGDSLVGDLLAVSPRLSGRTGSIPHGPLGSFRAGDVPTGACQLLFFGRAHYYKGLEHFIQLVVELRERRGREVIGVIAGRGPELTRMKAYMLRKGGFNIDDRFIPMDAVERYFTQASAVVLPYLDGTQSGVAALALGYGTPVIATRVGAVPELVIDGVNGILVDVGDVSAMADAAERLIDDRAFRASLACGAVALRDGRLSWDSIAHKTLDLYEQARKWGWWR